MVNDGSQEARNPKSGFETRSACRDDLDSACANSGDEWEREHTTNELPAWLRGWWQPITTHRGRRGPETEEKRSA